MRYNKKTENKQVLVTNHQGGTGYAIDPKLELIGILATGLDNSYYEKLTDKETRFKTLIVDLAKKDPEFVAKALVYARTVMGQRTVTHFGAVALTPALSGRAVARKFFSKREKKVNKGGIVFRLDDILEIVACYQHFNPGKPLPNSMKKGFKAALEAASEEANAISSRSNITSKDKLKGVQGLICVHLGDVSVDKNSILNAYPLNNIK